jgi:ribosomal protein L37AE/L43A
MIKEIKTTKEVIVKHKFCDDCGIEIKRDMACSIARCEICGKDLCDKCIGHETLLGNWKTLSRKNKMS